MLLLLLYLQKFINNYHFNNNNNNNFIIKIHHNTNNTHHTMRLLLSLLLTFFIALPYTHAMNFPNARPPPSQRKFNSSIIESTITTIANKMKDQDLAMVFSNCLPNTLDTTVESFIPASKNNGRPDSFIITGDITAQWLRDSTNQVLPYIQFTPQDGELQELVCGLILRQAANVLHDPYANAFNFNASGAGHQDDQRRPPMTKSVFEGKYELDSIMAALKLAYHYYNVTQDDSCFLQDSTWMSSVLLILSTVQEQQNSTVQPQDSAYYFMRTTNVATDTTVMSGIGAPARKTGLIKSMFRPSDDATTLPFLIPANMMAVVELGHLSDLLSTLANSPMIQNDVDLMESMKEASLTAKSIAAEVDAALQRYAIVPSPSMWTSVAPRTDVIAYEADGFGSSYFMDDANVPSLLSLPYLGYLAKDDPTYLATRAYLLSDDNPYFFRGSAGEGIGGPHVGLGHIWPMGIIIRALTSTNDTEILWCLDTLKTSTAGTGFMHESFNSSNVYDFTRPWFAWANTLFGELILTLAAERPYLIFNQEHLEVM
jgi:meiotically up-regulated gene 157 (Mug157) protein